MLEAFRDPEALWLNLTNATLGLVAIIGVLAVVGTVVYELLSRRRAGHPAQLHAVDDHAIAIPGIGLAMADGGERTGGRDERHDKSSRKS